MSAAALVDNAPAASSRLLADVCKVDPRSRREPAHERLEAALGRDFADRLVAALVRERPGRSGPYPR